MNRFLLTIALFLGLALPMPALAQGSYNLVNTAVDAIGSVLPAFDMTTPGFSNCNAPSGGTGGACGFIFMAQLVVGRFRPILTLVAVLVITIMGTHMLIGQEDDRLEKTRVAMTALISGLVMLYLIDPFIAAFYGSQGEVLRNEGSGIAGGTGIINTEIGGLINWALVVVASLAVLIIIINALKAVLKGGSEDGVASIRKTLISVAVGLLILAFRRVIADRFVDNPTTPVPVLGIIVTVINLLLGFLALASLSVVLYAGVSLILSYGKDEQWQQAKGLLARSLVGFVVVLMSLSLVKFVIGPAVGA